MQSCGTRDRIRRPIGRLASTYNAISMAKIESTFQRSEVDRARYRNGARGVNWCNEIGQKLAVVREFRTAPARRLNFKVSTNSKALQ